MSPIPARTAPARFGPIHFNLGNATGYLAAVAARAFAGALDHELAPVGISPGQFPLLLLLAETDGRSPGELAKLAHLSEPTVIRTLDRMERDGLVHRVRSQTDRRQVRVLLTEKGCNATEPAMIAGFSVGAQALHGFTATERIALNALLRRSIVNLGVEIS
jgi:DNA-binding MarR family transcriptional regulator